MIKNFANTVRKILNRPLSFTLIKAKTMRLYKKNLKSNKYEKSFEKAMKKKETLYIKYFKKHYYYLLNIPDDSSIQVKSEKPYIFMFWHQGFDSNLPPIVKQCVDSIEKHRNGYELVLLDKNNYKEYVDIPDHIRKLVESKKLSLQNFSDYLRIKLLEKYDCLWIDSTIFALRDIPMEYSTWNYFSVKSKNIYKNKPEYLLFPNFPFGQVYLLGGKDKRIFSQCALFFEDYLAKKTTYFEYFQIYYLMHFLYLFDEKDKENIDALPDNNEHIEDYFYYRNEKFENCFINDSDVFAKLTYKTDCKEALEDKESLLYNVLNGEY